MASGRRGRRDAAAEHVRQAPDGNWYTETEWAAWRRDAVAEHARLGAMERRRATDGQAYTADEFRAWYHTTAQEFWENAQEVRQAPDGKWYTKTEWAAWKTGNVEQAPAALAAKHRLAAGAFAEAPEAPASPAAEQRQAAAAPAEAPEPAREQGPERLQAPTAVPIDPPQGIVPDAPPPGRQAIQADLEAQLETFTKRSQRVTVTFSYR